MIVYGLLGYVGMTIDSGMMMIPMLLAFAVSIAYNIHIFPISNGNSFYTENVDEP